MNFRKATLNDVEVLIKIRRQQLLDEGHEEINNVQGEMRAFFERKITSGELDQWIAEVDLEEGEHDRFEINGKKIVATGAFMIIEFPPAFSNPAGMTGYITNMYTEDSYRGRGLAGEILQRLETEGKERGLTKLLLHASEMGEKAYVKSGFKETLAVMEKLL